MTIKFTQIAGSDTDDFMALDTEGRIWLIYRKGGTYEAFLVEPTFINNKKEIEE